MKKQISQCLWLGVVIIYSLSVFIYPKFYINLLKPDTKNFIMLFDLRYADKSLPHLLLSCLNDVFSQKQEVFNPRNENEESLGYTLIESEERQIINSGNISYKNVSIMNSTKNIVDLSQLMANYTPLKERKNFKILIFHTHGTEGYLEEKTARTTDITKNVVAVGETLANELTKKGFKVIHDKTMFDQSSYNKSYQYSLKAVEEHIKNNRDIKIIIDLHRDAIENTKGERVKVTYDNNGDKTAQLMMVVGSNGGGLEHNNWKENLKFAVGVQEKAQNLYEGLMRPIDFRNERFNQQLGENYIILEVGTHGNTLSEAKKSVVLFADILDEYIK